MIYFHHEAISCLQVLFHLIVLIFKFVKLITEATNPSIW
jgi:hypothetical protein